MIFSIPFYCLVFIAIRINRISANLFLLKQFQLQYKKFSDDAAFLGEMIFGSVAMTYKGENICKIHKIPSPKQLMFTTIIHAPIKCLTGAIK